MFTDGACRGNPGPGGWGALLRFGDHEKQLSGADSDTTNNRMELMAAIQALEALKRPCQVQLFTDSTYVRNGISEWLVQWKKRNWLTSNRKPVKNADLWVRLEAATVGHEIQWIWVKGHSGHAENDLVDALARRAIDEHNAVSGRN